VLADVGRTQHRARAVNVAVRKLVIVPTDRIIAQRAGLMLGRIGRGSEPAVDAFVAATAAQYQPVVIITGDTDDFALLCASLPAVHVQRLAD
jgi:predicted nucleic acid-binding protein